MSKRRKQTRASTPAKVKIQDVFVVRPFEGLRDETDWVALRELVPAATAPLRLAPELIDKYGDRQVTVSTVLPMAWPALTKPDGRVFLGLQRGTQSGDVSRDIALSLLLALEAEPGGPVTVPSLPGLGPRLQDVIEDDGLDITMREGFDFWLDEDATDPEVKASLERANATVFPAVKLATARSAYWCQFPEKAHVRWVLPEQDDHAMAALARLAAAGELTLGHDTKFAGMFRAHGLLVPVWDLPHAPEPAAWETPVAEFADRYARAVAEPGPLDAAARRARQGLVSRQVTLR